jgi:sterol desaturase/sphingolipid hydroxylase (fatty acid hydroxylase superfamily)
MNAIPPVLFPLTFFVLLALEPFLPGRPQPKVRGWVPKAIVFFLVGALPNIAIPAATARALDGRSVLHLASLGTLPGVLIAALGTSLTAYLVHRASHYNAFLWRWTHQMHHSAERVDMAGFAYGHPFDIVLGVLVTSLTVAFLGVSPLAAAIAGYFAFLRSLFLHLNVRTPHWLGYVFQRPEMHCLHHERGVLAYNYGLPLWDIVFGTFRNPATWDAEAGFWDGASTRVGDMLLDGDVSMARHDGARIGTNRTRFETRRA